MNELKIYNIRDIDWTALSASQSFNCPLTATISVIDMDDREHPTTQTVTVISLLEMREFLIHRYSWKWLDVELTPEPTAAQRFEHIWNTFVDMKSEQINRSVAAWMIKYNPALTFFRDETGDSDKITYGAIQVANSGGISSSHTKMKGQTTPSIGSADTDGYRAVTVNGISAATAGPTTTNSVTTYDDSSAPATSTKSESIGDTASESGSTSSAKTTTGGNDTHSRDMHFEGSDALHTSTQMVQEEIEMRMRQDIGLRLLEEFTREFLFGCVGGDDCNE